MPPCTQVIDITSRVSNADNTIYFVYEPVNYEPGGDPQVVDLGAPAANKVLTENGDGTYNLTLSVTGKSHAQESKTKANVIVVLDLSNSMDKDASSTDTYVESEYGNYYKSGSSYKQLLCYSWRRGYYWASDGTHDTVYDQSYMEYKGTRYSKLEKGSRLKVAKAAVKSLAETLLENNEGEDADAVEIALVTFATRTEVYQPTTDAETFNTLVDSLSTGGEYNGGTNWEGGLLDANGYSFGDDDPVYVIFVSDGKPTFRTSANGYTGDNYYLSSYHVYGDGQEGDTNVTRCKNAAVKASTALIRANKRLYAVNAFSGNGAEGAESNMKALFGESTQNYFNADNQATLNAAFGKIIKEIENDLSYANVSITDGITNLTATMEVL